MYDKCETKSVEYNEMAAPASYLKGEFKMFKLNFICMRDAAAENDKAGKC